MIEAAGGVVRRVERRISDTIYRRLVNDARPLRG